MPSEILDIATIDTPDPEQHDTQTIVNSVETGEGEPKIENNDKPGRLKTKGSLLLHSRSAHDLFYGKAGDKESGTYPIIGLKHFASNVKNLSLLCVNDDPYAEAVLIKIESLLPDLENKLKIHTDKLKHLLDNMEGIEISFHESINPISIPLEFSTPYGFIAARYLAHFDNVVKLAHSAKHIGLISNDDWYRMVTKTKTSFRHIFSVSQRYRFSGVNRNDLAANNAAARNVIDKYGELEEEILKCEHRAIYVNHKH